MPKANWGPFQGRSGGAGGRDQLFLIAQDQFTVSPDIDEQLNFIMFIWFFGDQNAHIIGPDKTGLVGQDMDIGGIIYFNVQIPDFDIQEIHG